MLVCASQNGVMLYQMDNDEIGRLGTICMCEGYVGGTSIETISVPNSDTSKYLHNGQLLILHNDKTYNVIGVGGIE